MSEAARRHVDQKSTVTLRVGRYVGNDGHAALVDIGGQRITVDFATPWVPAINEPVWVDSVDGRLRLTGPTQPKPGIGTVVEIDGAQAVVETAFGTYTLTVAPTDPMPTEGDTVGINWSSQPWCTLLIDVPAPETPPGGPGGGGAVVHEVTFRAIDAGSTDRHRERWWTAQPRAGDTTYGAWFYGTQIKDTIPSGAEFVSLEFYVSRQQDWGAAPRFTLHDRAFIRTGVPGMSSYTVWDPPGGFQAPPDPAGWFDALKAGGAWYGVGLNQGGNNIFSSLAQDGMSGALRIKWR